jgi:hypothetical protein
MSNYWVEANRPLIGRLGLGGFLALVGIIGPVLFVIAESITYFSAGFNRNPVYDSISSLVWTQYGWVQTIGFLVWGFFIVLFSGAVLVCIPGARGFGLALTILIIFGFGMGMTAAFHADINSQHHTLQGLIHNYSAKIIFWLFPVALVALSPSLLNSPSLRGLAVYSLVISVVTVGLMLCILFFAEEHGWFGLFERILVANALVWFELLAFRIFQMELKNTSPRPETLVVKTHKRGLA